MVLMLSEVQVRIRMNTILRNEVGAKMSTSISLTEVVSMGETEDKDGPNK
jgi:hypothetical protein